MSALVVWIANTFSVTIQFVDNTKGVQRLCPFRIRFRDPLQDPSGQVAIWVKHKHAESRTLTIRLQGKLFLEGAQVDWVLSLTATELFRLCDDSYVVRPQLRFRLTWANFFLLWLTVYSALLLVPRTYGNYRLYVSYDVNVHLVCSIHFCTAWMFFGLSFFLLDWASECIGQGLERYFRDPRFDQNAVWESGKRKISWGETGFCCFPGSGIHQNLSAGCGIFFPSLWNSGRHTF